MTNEIALSTDNFDLMAQAMGMTQDAKQGSSTSSLPRLRVWNKPVMGEVEVKGKNKKMEVVEAPSYRLEQADGSFVYAKEAKVRIFMQRFMLKKYDSNANKYVKTYMSDNLNKDLKDNEGGFNCGKPSGYIADFKALPEAMQDLIRSIKRVRVVFGEVQLVDPVDENGEEIDVPVAPFIFEVENRDSFKNMGGPIAEYSKQRKLPLQHWTNLSLQVESTNTGAVFGIVNASADMSEQLEIDQADQDTFKDFTTWIENYNEYIVREWNANHKEAMSSEDEELVGEFVDLEDVEVIEEEAAE